MGKKETIHKLTTLLAIALRHKIGSIVNKDEIYASKYAKDADVLIKEAQKIVITLNLNIYDKPKLKSELKKKLNDELEKKDFLDDGKYEFIDEEIEKVLKELEVD